MSENSINGDSTKTATGNDINGIGRLWKYELSELYKIAVKFFRDNDSKLLHPTYDERNQILALVLQIKHGPFNADQAVPLGTLDFIGHDRRQAWSDLGNMDKATAMEKFVNVIDSKCEKFKLFVEAHRKEREAKELQRQLAEKLRLEEEKRRLEEIAVEQERKEQSQLFDESQRIAIREALNQQTYHQFKAYAQQQYPHDENEQRNLIDKLQEQHFQQYMQQIYQQQQLISTVEYLSDQHSTQSVQSTETFQQSPIGETNEKIYHQLNSTQNHPLYSQITNGESQLPNQNQVEQKINDQKPDNPDMSDQAYLLLSDSKQDKYQSTVATMSSVVTIEAEPDLLKEVEPVTEEEDDDEDDEEELGEVGGEVEKAQIWRIKEIKAFKEAIRKENSTGIIKINHGEIVTVSVPTHSDGTCIFWEFATDNYDIAFGLFFEWTENPGQGVSVHISEDSDDEDEDDADYDEEIYPETGANQDGKAISSPVGGDVEIGGALRIKEQVKPCSVILPIYRVPSHEEVFAGSHSYPDKGIYMLKFDNSYALWRSKTLYYRVYYNTKETTQQ